MKSRIIVTVACISLFGCTSARISKSLASGAIGCPVDAIEISDETASFEGLHNFTATCEGVEYYCSYMYPNPINCREHK
jgi:hypothetical protein